MEESPSPQPSPTGVWSQHSFPASLLPQVPPSHPPVNPAKLPLPWLCSGSAFHLQCPPHLNPNQNPSQPLPWSHPLPLFHLHLPCGPLVIHPFIHSLIQHASSGHLSVPGTVPGSRDRKTDQTQPLLSRSSQPWSYHAWSIIICRPSLLSLQGT